ncbi:MAG: hypothetical protein RLZZ312_1570 [Bacteroidota bacterium]
MCFNILFAFGNQLLDNTTVVLVGELLANFLSTKASFYG